MIERGSGGSASRVARRVLLLLLCVPPIASAQRTTSSLDLGAAAMRYADSLTANGGAVSPALAFDWPRATLGGAATFSHFASGWSSQAAINGSLFSRAAGLFVGELAATAGGSAHQDGTRTGQTLGVLRGHLMSEHAGGWLGGGAGRTWDGDTWRNVINAEAGAWMTAGATRLVVQTAPTSVDDTIRYTDSQLSAHWSNTSVELGAEIGFRAGATGRIVGGSGRRWGSAAVTTWLAPRVGLILSGGTYPIDLTQGFPGGRFLTFSVRLRSAPPAPSEPSAVSATPVATDEARMQFRAVSSARGLVVLEISAPGAKSVEVTGDFTGWQPVKLVALGGKWSVSLPIARGTHQINVRVDGGQWLVPPGLPPISDEFGGKVGLLVVE